jgi:tetratricopeptide (TPR) repeat protein
MGATTGIMLSAVGFMLLLGTSLAQAQESCTQPIANLTSLQGQVDVRATISGTWHSVALDAPLCEGNEIRTGPLSRAQIRLHENVPGTARDGTLMQLKERSSLVLPQFEKPGLIDLLRGQIHILTRTPKSLTIKTLFCNANVEGTEFLVQADTDNTKVSVYEGQVRVENDLGSTALTAGEAAIAEPNKPPRREVLIKPRDAVQWALYYPPIIDTRSAPPGPNQSVYRRALDLYKQGQIAEAISTLDKLADSQNEPYYHELRAALYLSVSQMDYARNELVSAITLDANDANAYALESIIALVQNQKDKAQEYARRAIAADKNSPTAWVADSYAKQANFKLDDALNSAQFSVRLGPDNALAWARVSELELARGNLGKADKAADESRSLDPTLARPQTIAGFAALTRTDIPKAKTAFTEAIRRDPADPLPRLGLGLAKIRKGQLADGRKDIEDAANIDPNNSLVRSYLGKAYYEEKRNDLAAKELENAKALDPKDPTPWFYDAIRKQTENRPIEALEDLQKSIRLNDSRAIFRSKLFLDRDLAARSAAQGRIYRNLGFEQLGLVQGWRSSIFDPGDYAGHRLLADSYSNLSRHQIARVSELLQSQLLQPLNLTPVQPHLAESNFIGLLGTGPSAPAFNEFNPLFLRDRFAFQASAITGSFDTFGDEVTHSAIFDNFSYSIGQYHNQTNGFRPNNDSQEDIVNGFLQAQFTTRLSAQIEYRHKELTIGDQQLYAENAYSDYDPLLRYNMITDTFRTGLHYALSPSADILASFIHLDRDSIRAGTQGISLNTRTSNIGNSGEAQYLFRSENLKATSGFGYSVSESAPMSQPNKSSAVSFANAYTYAYWTHSTNVTWTIGLSFDKMDNDVIGAVDLLNPKFGILWNITPKTTFRLAAFRALKRALLTSQTVEPTHVAGFNQFFDDYTGTTSERYGFALDHQLNRTLFLGSEVSARRLQFRGVNLKGDADERIYRTYINWTPTSSVAVHLGWQYDEFRTSAETALNFAVPKAVSEHQGEASLRFFNGSGFMSHLKLTYVSQSTRDPPLPKDIDTTNTFFNNNFFLVDIGIGYRLPKRYGIIGLEMRNVFDERFNYQSLGRRQIQDETIDQGPVPFFPERSIFAQFTLAY